jgi:hypothetical protein
MTYRMSKLRNLMAAAALTLLSGCASSGQPIKGRVLEEGTSRPVDGAIVLARWIGTAPGFAHSQSACVHVESALTNIEGAFTLPGWSKSSVTASVTNLKMMLFAYRAGYELPQNPSPRDDTVYVAPFRGTREQRLAYIARISGNATCGTSDPSEQNSLPLLKGLRDEAAMLARSKDELNLLESLRFSIEKIELGYDEAERRYLQRVK